jgi:hypothetical protein
MADNVDITPGAGKTVATDDVGGIQYQRVKACYGVDGAATDVSDTNPMPIDDAGGTLTVDSLQLPAALVGGRLDVVVGAALPTGTNNIGDVDVLTMPGTFAEDAAHVSGDVGVQMLAVRKVTPANLSGTDGDYEPLQISAGRLWTSTTVTGTLDTDLYANCSNADGGGDIGRLLVVGGTDGANNQTLSLDTTGALKLATGTNNIGDVDVLTLPGAFAEDAAHASGDIGHQVLTVRSDTPTAKGGTDGDYQPVLTNNEGLVWVIPSPKVVRLSVTPTISNGAVYASGDVIGGLQTISNAVRKAGGSGTILSIVVIDKTQAQRAAMDILFFDRSVTVAADNAAVATSDADMANCLGIVSIGPYNTAFPGTPLNSLSTLLNVGLPIVCNGADLFAVVVSRGTPTYTSTSDLEFKYTILQD